MAPIFAPGLGRVACDKLFVVFLLSIYNAWAPSAHTPGARQRMAQEGAPDAINLEGLILLADWQVRRLFYIDKVK